MMMKQFKLDILRPLSHEINEAREIAAVLQTISKKCIVGMLSDVYESIWFNYGIMIGTAELYKLTLVFVTLHASSSLYA